MIKRIKKFIALLLTVMCTFSLIPEHTNVKAASTPRVMLTDYSFSTDKIYAGDSFTLDFTLENTAWYEVRNIKCTVFSENGEIIPIKSAGTGYIDKLPGEETAELSFELESLKNLEEKAYKLTIQTEYEDWDGSYEAKDTIYVPINLGTEIVVSDVYIADENIHLGDNIEILATVNNTGAGKIYKVIASVSGDHVNDGSTFVGNIEPGKSGNVDIIVKTKALMGSGMKNELTISYENLDGEEFSETIQLGQIDVKEQSYAGLIEVKEDTEEPMLSDRAKLWIVAGAIVLVIILLMLRRKMKLRKLEREFE
ncbi:MAG: hypothetical protein J6O17_03025 [Eubacterium sp.]|nr:hypothetical protein [Eubacterium sp.]